MNWRAADLDEILRRGHVRILEGPQPVRPEVSERAFLAAVVRLARQQGYLVYHTWNAKRSPEGFPDLVCVHPTRRELPVLAWELKSATGQVTPAQQAWLAALDGRQTVSAVWRPEDMEEIRRLLC